MQLNTTVPECSILQEIPDALLLLQPRDYSPQLFALEYTRLDSDLISLINCKQFIHQLHTKQDIQPLLQAIQFFNSMSKWFLYRYNEEISDCKVLFVDWMVNVAKEFEYLNNFNGLMVIVIVMNQIKLPTLTDELLLEIKRLEELMNMSHNYKNYRNRLLEISGPCNPFLGLFIKDLYFIEEGNVTFSDQSTMSDVSFASSQYLTSFNSSETPSTTSEMSKCSTKPPQQPLSRNKKRKLNKKLKDNYSKRIRSNPENVPETPSPSPVHNATIEDVHKSLSFTDRKSVV